jgi:sigma-E factor negative regulatory protein RseA
MNPNPDALTPPDDDRRLLVSRLVDGECDAEEVRRLCADWRDDVALQRDWHRYQLIGDVMRSDDLASPPSRDLAFLQTLRVRLADEPPIVAPSPLPPSTPIAAASKSRQAWLAPAAIAAGFVAVAGVLVVTRLISPTVEPRGAVLAGSGAGGGLQRAGVGTPAGGSAPTTFDAQLIRDAQIDAYLRAHREARGSSAAAVPGGVMRSVDTIVPQR